MLQMTSLMLKRLNHTIRLDVDPKACEISSATIARAAVSPIGATACCELVLNVTPGHNIDFIAGNAVVLIVDAFCKQPQTSRTAQRGAADQ